MVSCHLQTVSALLLFQSGFLLFLFSSLIAVAGTFRTILNNSGESEHPCLVPDLTGNAFSFSLLRIIFAVGWTSLVAQMVKHLPTMWETHVRSLSWEDPLEKEMATHSSTLAWKIPWTGKHCRLQSMGSQRVGHDWATSLVICIIYGLYYVDVSSFYPHFLKSFFLS